MGLYEEEVSFHDGMQDARQGRVEEVQRNKSTRYHLIEFY